MFDILVYLFENYFHADACPAPEQLAIKLSAAGFEDDDISLALEWLSGLQRVTGTDRPSIAENSSSVRFFAQDEQIKLGADCRGFLQFLETAGVVNAVTREMIIALALSLDEARVPLSKFKVIALMVLWNQRQDMDTLILEELLSERSEGTLH
jgi:Smg protein